MRRLKFMMILLSVVLAACVVVISVLLATLDNEDYRDILTWTVDHFTDYRISMNGPLILDVSMTPSLAISDFRIEPNQSDDQPFLAQGKKLKITLDIKSLLTGTLHIRELVGENGTFAFTAVEGATSDKSFSKDFDNINGLILENVTLRNVKISYSERDENAPIHINLRSFRIDAPRDSGPVYVKGEGAVNNADFVIKGSVPGRTMEGPESKGANLTLHLTAKNTKIFKTFLFDWLPDTGPVTGEVQLTGSLERLALEGLNVTAGKRETVLINVKGRLGWIPIGPDSRTYDIDLSLSTESNKPKVLFSGLDVSLPELSYVSGSTRIRGSGDKLQFDEIDVQATERGGVKLDLSGSASLEDRGGNTPLGRLDLNASLKAPSIESFQYLLGSKALPDLAPASFTGHVTGTTETLSLEDIVLQAGKSGSILATWKGRIGKLEFGAEQPISDVEIATSIYAGKTSLFSPYVGVSIPDLGPMESTARIAARKGGYGYDDMELLIGTKENVRLHAEGHIEYVMRGTSVGIDGIDLAVTIPELDGEAFSKLLGQHIAAIGKLTGSLSVSGGQEDLSVSDADLVTVSPDGLKLTAKGGVSHIRMKEKMPFNGVDIKLSATAPDITEIRKIIDLDFPDLGTLSMTMEVKDRDKELIINQLKILTGPEEKPTLLIEGMIHPLEGQHGVTGKLAIQTYTRPWSEKFLGHPVSEDHLLEGSLRVSSKKNNENFEGTINVGKTKLRVTVERSFKNEQSHIAAKVSAPKIYLSELDSYPDEDQAKKSDSASDSRLFSDKPLPFDSLKKLNLSLNLEADEVIGKDFTLHNLNLDVALDSGLSQKRIHKLRHADDFVSIEAAIDTRNSKPELTLKVNADDIDAAALLTHMRSQMLLGGHLNMAVDLRSTGSSPREIASALKGEIAIEIENGKIAKIADLIGADVIDLLTTVKKATDYKKLNCLAVAFSFDEGIGTSKVIYIDTPHVRSVGKGKVNLQEETIDVVIQPKPKKGQLGGSSPARIYGPLARPSVMKIPLRELARLTGEVLLPYVFLPLRTLGYTGILTKDDQDENSPCQQPASQPETGEKKVGSE